MKRIIKLILSTLFILYFLHACVYHRMTHIIDKKEMEWITNRYEGEKMYFQSTEGEKDTIKIFRITIWNSLNPFHMDYFSTSSTEYIAGGEILFTYNKIDGCENFLITKTYNNKPLDFYCSLFDRHTLDIPFRLTKLKINHVVLNDVLLFDENNTEQIKIRSFIRSSPLKKYAWSRKYGLVMYAFEDGTTYTRIDIK